MDYSEKALSFFDTNYNCAQSVLVTFAEDLGITEDESLKVASAFGGGIARQQLTCGAVTGAAMALGLRYGKGISDSDENKLDTYQKTIELFNEFTRLNGSTSCFELLNNLDMNNEEDHKSIVDQNLFHTHCRKYVADAVAITEKLLHTPKI